MDTKSLLSDKPLTFAAIGSLIALMVPVISVMFWFYSEFATAKDLKKSHEYLEKSIKETQLQLKSAVLSFDKVSTDIQADVIEDRLSRELEKSNPDPLRVEKLKRRLDKFDARSEQLEKVILKTEGSK